MNIYQKLIEVRKSVPYLKKDARSYGYTYVKESTVIGTIQDQMNAQGLLLIQEITSAESLNIMIKDKSASGVKITFQYTWINAEKPEEKIVCSQILQDASCDVKACGSLMTYGMRYFLLKFFNIATDNDDPDAFEDRMKKPIEPEQEEKTISPVQAELLKKMTEGNTDILKQIASGFGISRLGEIPKEKFEEVKFRINQIKTNRQYAGV